MQIDVKRLVGHAHSTTAQFHRLAILVQDYFIVLEAFYLRLPSFSFVLAASQI